MLGLEQISGEVCSTNVPRLKPESGAFSFLGDNSAAKSP